MATSLTTCSPAGLNGRGARFTAPCVAQVADEGLQFIRPVTFLVGGNGSGKSTLVEAIAEGFKPDSHGGRASTKTRRPNPTKATHGEVLRLDTTAEGPRSARARPDPRFWVQAAHHAPELVLSRFDYAFDPHAAVEVTKWMPGNPSNRPATSTARNATCDEMTTEVPNRAIAESAARVSGRLHSGRLARFCAGTARSRRPGGG